MKATGRPRRILHVDLHPFFVSVERSLDPTLRGRPVVVGGDVVAAASDEARAAGVRPGQVLETARRICPEAAFRPGDLATYARVSDDVTGILLAASRRVERPSADEAFVDLTPEPPGSRPPAAAAEAIKEELQRRAGLDASLGLASSRLAARVASTWARPRGLLVVLPGYESSFVGRQPLSFLSDLPHHLEAALLEAGFTTLGHLAEGDPAALEAAVGPVAARALRQTARGEGEEPVAVAAPPSVVLEQAAVRARGSDRAAIESLLDGLVVRACRRLRPFGLAAGAVAVEVRRAEGSERRAETIQPGIGDEETLSGVTRGLLEPLVEPAATIREVALRLSRLEPPLPQAPLFPAQGSSALR